MLQIGATALVGMLRVRAICLVVGFVRNTADITYTSPFFRVLGLTIAGVFPFGFGDAFEYR